MASSPSDPQTTRPKASAAPRAAPTARAEPPYENRTATLSNQAISGLILYALLALTVWVYWPGLSGPLVLDDVENLRPLNDLGQGLVAWQDLVLTNASGPLGRSISMASFAANYLASGGEVWSLKYTNLMLHLLCGALVFWLGGRLFVQARLRAPWRFALAATALWLFAPLLVSTVLYVVQRMAQLAALFTLAGLLSYVVGRQTVAKNRLLGSALMLSAFLLWMPLAAFSKETGLLLPLLALVIEAFFFRFHGDRYARGLLAAVFTVFLVVPGAVVLLKLALDPGFVTAGYSGRDFTLEQRVLTEPRILFSYLSALLFPYGPAFGPYHDDYPLSTGMFSPPATAVAIVAWLAALAVPWLTRSSTIRFLGFGLAFFLAGHAMESTIFPLELYFEHRNYLPSIGVFLGLGAAAHQLLERVERKRLIVLLAAMVPLFCAAASHQRALVWRSWYQIVLTAERFHPDSRRVNMELAVLYGERGDLTQALHHLDRADALDSKLTAAVTLRRALIHCLAGARLPPPLLTELDGLPTLDWSPPTIAALRNLAAFLLDGKCPGLDSLRFAAALQKASQGASPRARWEAQFQLARLYNHVGKSAEAIAHLDQATRILPHRLEPGLFAVQIELENLELDKARKTLNALKEADTGAKIGYTRSISLYEQLLDMLERAPEKPTKIEIQ